MNKPSIISKAFADEEKEKQIQKLSNPIFESAEANGYTYFTSKTKQRFAKHFPFILTPEHSIKNLYAPIRQESLDYFERYGISWWRQYEDCYFPNGHVLSSQNHCLNHLFGICRDKTAVLSIINSLDANIQFDEVLPSPLDNLEEKGNTTYITFEFTNSNTDLLKERMSTRGANCTSVDATIYALSKDGRYYLIPIEWKYTEYYEMKYAIPQWKINKRYRPLVDATSNLIEWNDSLYNYDPYYEFARQELFIEQIIKKQNTLDTRIKVDDFIHVIVCPARHVELRNAITEFQSTLRNKRKFICKDPQELLQPLNNSDDPQIKDLLNYLEQRYWN